MNIYTPHSTAHLDTAHMQSSRRAPNKIEDIRAITTVEESPAASMDDDLQWAAVSPEHPCPICGAFEGCGVAPCPECIAVNCLRVVSDIPMTDGGWFHRLSIATVLTDEMVQ